MLPLIYTQTSIEQTAKKVFTRRDCPDLFHQRNAPSDNVPDKFSKCEGEITRERRITHRAPERH